MTQTTPVFPISYAEGWAWYVLAIESRREFAVEAEIKQDLDFMTYVPRTLEKRVQRGRRVDVAYPLFPGYGFVLFDINRHEWGRILEAEGVIDILSNNQTPVRVATPIISRLRRAEQAGAFDFRKPGSAFKPGDDVEIKEGPFSGLIAKVRSATKKKRIEVALNFLGGLTVFSLDTCALVKV